MQEVPVLTCNQVIENFPELHCLSRNCIQSGSSGAIFLTSLAESDSQKRIIKVQSLSDPSFRKRALKERKLGWSFSHPNVVFIFDEKISSDGRYLFQVMEYGEKGTLQKFRRTNSRFLEDRKNLLVLFKEILQGISYIHKMGWVHADLKLDNIIVDSHNNPKLIDFDISKKIGHFDKKEGTIQYMAPELIFPDDPNIVYNESIDIWALGVIFYYLFSGKFPWSSIQVKTHFSKDQVGDIIFDSKWDLEVANIVSKCLRSDPGLRPSAEQLLHLTDIALSNEDPRNIQGFVYDSPLAESRDQQFLDYESYLESAPVPAAGPGEEFFLRDGEIVEFPEMPQREHRDFSQDSWSSIDSDAQESNKPFRLTLGSNNSSTSIFGMFNFDHPKTSSSIVIALLLAFVGCTILLILYQIVQSLREKRREECLEQPTIYENTEAEWGVDNFAFSIPTSHA